MKNALELQNVSKSFKGFEMKDMTFSLPEGCILGLVGKNGAGKSTTIHLIMDMIHKDSGTIYVLGKNIEEDFTETKQDIGVVLDEPSFPEYVTADQMNNIMKNIYRNWDEKRYYELIDQFELPKWKKQFKNYSKGMKMKLAIAVALSHHAKLLILDEPTSGLDPFMRDEILDILYEFTTFCRNLCQAYQIRWIYHNNFIYNCFIVCTGHQYKWTGFTRNDYISFFSDNMFDKVRD